MCRLGGYARLVDNYKTTDLMRHSDRHDAASNSLISYRYTGYGQNYGKEIYANEQRDASNELPPAGTPEVYRGQKCC